MVSLTRLVNKYNLIIKREAKICEKSDNEKNFPKDKVQIIFS